MFETVTLRGRVVELRKRFGKAASDMKKKPKREKRATGERNHKISKPAIVAVPAHGSFTGFLRSSRNS